MRLHGRGVDQHLGGRPTGLGQGLEQITPDPLGRPAHETIVEGLLRAVDLTRGVRPTPARLQHVNDPADHAAVIDTLLASGVCRQVGPIFANCSSMNQNSAIGASFPQKESQTHPLSQTYGSGA